MQSLPEIFYGYHKTRAGARGNVLEQIPFAAPPETRAAAGAGPAHCQILAVRMPDMQAADAMQRDAFAA
jgi:hypothetical protein